MTPKLICLDDLGTWKPPIDVLPEVTPHELYLNQVRYGGTIITLDEANELISRLQLAVATQMKRSTEPVANGGGS